MRPPLRWTERLARPTPPSWAVAQTLPYCAVRAGRGWLLRDRDYRLIGWTSRKLAQCACRRVLRKPDPRVVWLYHDGCAPHRGRREWDAYRARCKRSIGVFEQDGLVRVRHSRSTAWSAFDDLTV